MALDIDGILNAVVSHAMATGYFATVNGHEPKTKPDTGLTAAVWVDRVQPIQASSLTATSLRLVFNVRLYTSMLSEPQDAIDPDMTRAMSALLAAYTGDFTLGGLLRNVDLLGAHGDPMQVLAGYISQDTRMYRVYTITLPTIVNDTWEQNP